MPQPVHNVQSSQPYQQPTQTKRANGLPPRGERNHPPHPIGAPIAASLSKATGALLRVGELINSTIGKTDEAELMTKELSGLGTLAIKNLFKKENLHEEGIFRQTGDQKLAEKMLKNDSIAWEKATTHDYVTFLKLLNDKLTNRGTDSAEVQTPEVKQMFSDLLGLLLEASKQEHSQYNKMDQNNIAICAQKFTAAMIVAEALPIESQSRGVAIAGDQNQDKKTCDMILAAFCAKFEITIAGQTMEKTPLEELAFTKLAEKGFTKESFTSPPVAKQPTRERPSPPRHRPRVPPRKQLP